MLSINRKTAPLPTKDAQMIADQLRDTGGFKEQASAMMLEKLDVVFQVVAGIRGDLLVIDKRVCDLENQTPVSLFKKYAVPMILTSSGALLTYILIGK